MIDMLRELVPDQVPTHAYLDRMEDMACHLVDNTSGGMGSEHDSGRNEPISTVGPGMKSNTPLLT